jgi:predicted ArsR family transcriptional regulator
VNEVPAPQDPAATFDRLAPLCDPVRRDLFFFISERGDWVSRNEAADALGLRRGLVAHHLDRLAADGLLQVDDRRLTGRSGPGAGRPAKLYRPTTERFSLSIPARNPAVVAQLLADSIGETTKGAVFARARKAGATMVNATAVISDSDRRRAIVDALTAYGYSPRVSDGELTLTNCPYDPLASAHRALVCGMNLSLVEGAIAAVALRGVTCSLRTPTNGECCVRVGPWREPIV